MKKIKQPLVSVIMPVYNAGDFLVPAIESILKQTYKNIEFLIVDDGSKDDSWNIIKAYQKKYPQIIKKTLRLKKNTNAAGNGAVNKILPRAKGKFIARMDADDISDAKRLEKQVEFLNRHPEIILVGTQAKVIDKNGKIIGKKSYPLDHQNIYQKYAQIHPIIHPSCMIRRSSLPNPNRLYQMRFGVNDDYYTFFKLLNIGKFANLPSYLLKYRIHGNNASLSNLKANYKNISNIRKEAIKNLNYKITLKSRLIVFLQNLLVAFIPEKLLTSSYLTLRGINTHSINDK